MAQATPAAPMGTAEMRGLRWVEDPNKAIMRLRGKINSKTTGAIYTGPSPAKLSIHNNAVLFQDKLVKALNTTDGGVWAPTPDHPSLTGLSHHRPSLDRMTPLRSELLQIIGDHLGTHDEILSNAMVEVPAIDGSFSPIPAHELPATEWLRKLVGEGQQQSGGREAAETALHAITVRGSEAWKAAARRLVVVYRAFVANPIRPHISEAAFFWRYISEIQLSDLLERIVQCYYRARSIKPACKGWCMSASCE